MELTRRCEDCRRVVKGALGDACPYCGGENLRDVIAAPKSNAVRHGSVLTAVITFCLGLSLLRVVMVAIGSRSFSSAAYGEMLWQLQLLTASGALVYVVLRRSEGDFRALFIISLILYVGTECSAALARDYGFLALNRLCALFNMGLFIFSTMTITAAVADGWRVDRYRVCLLLALGGFIGLAALRTFFLVRTRVFDDHANTIGTLFLTGIVLYLGVMLLRREFSEKKPAAPKPLREIPNPLLADTPAPTDPQL